MKYKHILLATDLLEGTDKVARKAKQMAEESGAKLSVIHVVEPLPGYGYAFISPVEIEEQLIDEAKKQLSKLAKKYDFDAANLHVQMGPTKVEILDLAEANKVDLIVLGSHGRHGIAHLLGSTANAVVHNAKCDVLTVRVD